MNHHRMLLLRGLFAEDTSELPSLWSPSNRSAGHCHVASLVYHHLSGGKIIRGIVMDPTYISGPITHYWINNGGVMIDLTADQFIHPTYLPQRINATFERRSPDTEKKFKLLLHRYGLVTKS